MIVLIVALEREDRRGVEVHRVNRGAGGGCVVDANGHAEIEQRVVGAIAGHLAIAARVEHRLRLLTLSGADVGGSCCRGDEGHQRQGQGEYRRNSNDHLGGRFHLE